MITHTLPAWLCWTLFALGGVLPLSALAFFVWLASRVQPRRRRKRRV